MNMRPQLIFSTWKAIGMQGPLDRISSVELYNIPGSTTINHIFMLICHLFVYSHSKGCARHISHAILVCQVEAAVYLEARQVGCSYFGIHDL